MGRRCRATAPKVALRGPRGPISLLHVIRESYETLAGASTRVLEVDGGEGPALVLLHGFTASPDTGRPLLERLDRAGRRAVAMDLPGFGVASDARAGPVLPQFEAA